jgi:hypothetical protein
MEADSPERARVAIRNLSSQFEFEIAIRKTNKLNLVSPWVIQASAADQIWCFVQRDFFFKQILQG